MNSIATRNCRRAAVRSFAASLGIPYATIWPTRPLASAHASAGDPVKEGAAATATYLEADDVRAIIAKPDRCTLDGSRLLLFLYNFSARVSEVTAVQWSNLVPPRRYAFRVSEGTARAAMAGNGRCVASTAKHGGRNRPAACSS